MRIGLVAFHRDANDKYPSAWISNCVASVHNQTVQPDAVYEIDYGAGEARFFADVHDGDYEWHSRKLVNYAAAMNFLLDRGFDDGCDVVFNTNIDDVYALRRIETMVAQADGADLVSCDFNVISATGRVLHTNEFHDMDIEIQFGADHNIICHPGVMWTRKFWTTCSRYDPAEVPEEDFALWRRELHRQRFVIVPETLVSVRSHDHNVGKDPNYR